VIVYTQKGKPILHASKKNNSEGTEDRKLILNRGVKDL
jgi:hypothetical protein